MVACPSASARGGGGADQGAQTPQPWVAHDAGRAGGGLRAATLPVPADEPEIPIYILKRLNKQNNFIWTDGHTREGCAGPDAGPSQLVGPLSEPSLATSVYASAATGPVSLPVCPRDCCQSFPRDRREGRTQRGHRNELSPSPSDPPARQWACPSMSRVFRSDTSRALGTIFTPTLRRRNGVREGGEWPDVPGPVFIPEARPAAGEGSTGGSGPPLPPAAPLHAFALSPAVAQLNIPG